MSSDIGVCGLECTDSSRHGVKYSTVWSACNLKINMFMEPVQTRGLTVDISVGQWVCINAFAR